jgi:hypothetical protein
MSANLRLETAYSRSDGRSDTAGGTGQPEPKADEEKNLGGAGSLERGKPISRFFETLEYRGTNPEGDIPEVPERRPNGGVPTAGASRRPGQGSRGRRGGPRRRAKGGCGGPGGQGREGEGPREGETQESRGNAGTVETRWRTPSRQGDQTLAARPFRTPSPESVVNVDGKPMIRDAKPVGRPRDASAGPRAEAERRRGTGTAHGEADRRSARPVGTRHHLPIAGREATSRGDGDPCTVML